MTLSDYLERRGETMTAFAARAGIILPNVSRIASGKIKIPQPEIMWKIYVATGGLVGPEDYYDFKQRLFTQGCVLQPIAEAA